jgi:hypothetical protein
MIRVITGHICSGKSWHVSRHARPDDVIIDMDVIALALAADGTTHHAYPRHVGDIARVARWSAMDEAIRRHRDGGFDVWIIHAYPEDKDWTTYRRIGATITAIDCDANTLVERAEAERPASMLAELERRLAHEGKSAVFAGKTA